MNPILNSIKKICVKITKNPAFNHIILLTILVNAAVIGLETYSSLNAYKPIFILINLVALTFFILEAVIKITAVSPNLKKYFYNHWDLFDFIIVILAFIPGIGILVTLARLSRLLRILKLVRQFEELKTIIDSLVRAIPSIANILLLLLLLFYIYGILGVHLFSGVDSYRWGTLGASMLTLFTVVTLTNWDIVFYKTLLVNPYSWIYFFSFVLLGSLMIINLFVGVMVFHITESRKKVKEISNKNLLKEIKEMKNSLKKIENKISKRK